MTTSSPENILSAWTALEVLSPSTFKSTANLAATYNGEIKPFDQEVLPWNENVSPPKGFRFYYHIILGTISYEPAVNALLDTFGDDRPERPKLPGEVILAAILLDDRGHFIGTDPIVVSSFGWGLPVALSGNLRQLAGWNGVEQDLIQMIRDSLERTDQDGNLLPLDASGLLKARNSLLTALHIPPALITAHSFAIRCKASIKAPSAPEPLLLNSFFLNDLSLSRDLFADGQAPVNLQRYLGLIAPDTKLNLLSDHLALDALLAPAQMQPSRWPGPERHPLVLLQQAAVNAAFISPTESAILAVNGPPGTGKTTLLRDVVAGVVTRRAEALCQFDLPTQAFNDSGEKLSVGSAYLRLYQLDERIRGHELLIASSNNKAVENVSAELPGIGAIADDATDLRYFTCLSDALLNRETWGLVAAVLGNSANRYAFSKTFWWDPEVGLATYLAEAAGTPQWIDDKDPATMKIIGQRKPRIIMEEAPPESQAEALDRWEAAKTQFQNALSISQGQLDELEKVREQLKEQLIWQKELRQASSFVSSREKDLSNVQQLLNEAQKERDTRQSAVDQMEQQRNDHRKLRPGFWKRLFRTPSFKAWNANHQQILENWRIAAQLLDEQSLIVEQQAQAVSLAEAAFLQANQQLTNASRALQRLDDSIATARLKYTGTWLDESFYRKSHATRHLVAPWCDKVIHRLRDNVFIRALELHKAFIDACAQPLKHNLGALIYALSRGTLPDEAKMSLLPDLWSSLFLVVPAISTTFASVERLLGSLPPASLGWLLVDEAGQALPQAAVGAILRTRRAVVVGDPLQIEPVVVLPETLTTAICDYFNVDPLKYNAPKASVQTLADEASPYYAEFEQVQGSRAVGIPLLVHRRCSDPMFSISNIIAYARLMVSAKTPKPSAIRDLLGPSRWIDVQGSPSEKWCPEEGQSVLDILSELKKAGVQPNLYIITPFAIVSDKLRNLIIQSGILENWVADPGIWPYQRIGTVHTVQGREAEAVIFILGAPAPDQAGARYWAGRTPNLLNVAVTRAKEVLYVVGNRKLWEGSGVFRQLADHL